MDKNLKDALDAYSRVKAEQSDLRLIMKEDGTLNSWAAVEKSGSESSVSVISKLKQLVTLQWKGLTTTSLPVCFFLSMMFLFTGLVLLVLFIPACLVRFAAWLNPISKTKQGASGTKEESSEKGPLASYYH